VIGQVISCGSIDYPLIEGRPVKQLRFELQDTMGVRLSITLWGPYAEQVDEALGDRTKLSILIMQFAKHKIYRGKPSLSNLYNCTRFFINEDIPEIINFKKSVVAIVGTETPKHPIAPLVTYKKIFVRDEFLTHLDKVNLAYIRDIRKAMSCVIVGTIKCVERETKWYYLGCRACNFGVDPKTEDYKDKESGLVKKKIVGYICKNKSCGEVSDVLYKVSQICQEPDVIEELELKVPTLEFVNSVIRIHITTISTEISIALHGSNSNIPSCGLNDIPNVLSNSTFTHKENYVASDSVKALGKRRRPPKYDISNSSHCNNSTTLICGLTGIPNVLSNTTSTRNENNVGGDYIRVVRKHGRPIKYDISNLVLHGSIPDTPNLRYTQISNMSPVTPNEESSGSNVANHSFHTSSSTSNVLRENTSMSSRKHNLRNKSALLSDIPILDFDVAKDDDVEIDLTNSFVGVSKEYLDHGDPTHICGACNAVFFMSQESQLDNVKLKLVGRRTSDGRTYNLPIASEIAVLIVGDIEQALDERVIVVESRNDASKLGKSIVLPSSFIGGARFMRQNYLDAMTLCKWFGHPDFFITFTCNPKWLEISRFVRKRGLKPEDRPEVLCRMFKLKLDHLIKNLKDNQIFDRVQAVVYTIEFKKHGLPHSHICLFLHKDDKLLNPERINDFISAEIPDKELDLDLFTLMTEHMMHGPCGADNLSCLCTIKGVCTKKILKKYSNRTTNDSAGYPIYRRREDGKFVEKNCVCLDNVFVVPYNSYLLKKYQAHINVEWCNQAGSIKYLFKYINKGPDRVTAMIQVGDRDNEAPSNIEVVDEIKDYYDCRYLSACESSWRILKYKFVYRTPAVERLPFHLPGQQQVVYDKDDDIDDVLNKPSVASTKFLAWMDINKTNDLAKTLTYAEFPTKDACFARGLLDDDREYILGLEEIHGWELGNKWPEISRFVRKRGLKPEDRSEVLCRMFKFKLDHLIKNLKDNQIFGRVQTVVYTIEFQKRRLPHSHICLFLHRDDKLLNPERINDFVSVEIPDKDLDLDLYTLVTEHMMHDNPSCPCTIKGVCTKIFPKKYSNRTTNDSAGYPVYRRREDDLEMRERHIKNLILKDMDAILRKNRSCLSNISSMPLPDLEFLQNYANTLIHNEVCYNRDELRMDHKNLFSSLTTEQQSVYCKVISAVKNNKGGVFFLYGYGGTGKTYIWRTLSAAIRCKGDIVLNVASSGIASLLLPGGRTTHSRFAIPINVDETSVCLITHGSDLAALLGRTKLIIWDEAPMLNKHCFKALDRTLRDILRVSNIPFGGKVIVFGGGFRQILPIITGGTRQDIVNASLNSSYLWDHINVLQLTKNMRLKIGSASSNNDDIKEFTDWILKVGDGRLGGPNDGEAMIDILEDILIKDCDDPVGALVSFVYPSVLSNLNNNTYFQERAILAPTHEVVEFINDHLLSLLPGKKKVYLSSDSICESECLNDNFNESLYSPGVLNGMKLAGLPNHMLVLKVGAPVMLLRNIDQSEGLCNGTRLRIKELGDRAIKAEILTGTKIGETMSLFRFKLTPSDKRLPLQINRQ
nr:hypothetical protein [Tanacetum cinerariifolium]